MWGDLGKEKNTPEKWEKVDKTISVVFYDDVRNERGDSVWLEFEFSFIGGKLDKKKLIKAEVYETKEQKEATEKMWKIENEIYDHHKRKFKVRLFEWASLRLRSLQSWVSARHQIPKSVTEKAHKASGRNE
jgi:hypothetical protein